MCKSRFLIINIKIVGTLFVSMFVTFLYVSNLTNTTIGHVQSVPDLLYRVVLVPTISIYSFKKTLTDRNDTHQ